MKISPSRQSCPFLPDPDKTMDYRCLHRFGESRDAGFYFTALQYAQFLWVDGLSARSILALNRAIFSEITGNEDLVKRWPMPYRALVWILNNHKDDTFLGNPRISYQHLATRIRGDRKEQRQWQAWACWYLVRQNRPDLPGDMTYSFYNPEKSDILENLKKWGGEGESETWENALSPEN